MMKEEVEIRLNDVPFLQKLTPRQYALCKIREKLEWEERFKDAPQTTEATILKTLHSHRSLRRIYRDTQEHSASCVWQAFYENCIDLAACAVQVIEALDLEAAAKNAVRPPARFSQPAQVAREELDEA
jgi:hypothetical protein